MKVATHHYWLGLALSSAVALAGCRTMAMPRLASPGSAGYQRYNALQYDPYPLDDIAPPIAGTRPQEYSRPIPEVTRGQAFNAKPRVPQPVLSPSFAAPVSPVITAPPVLPAAPTVSPFAPPATVPYQGAPNQTLPIQTVPYPQGLPPAPLTAPPPAANSFRAPY